MCSTNGQLAIQSCNWIETVSLPRLLSKVLQVAALSCCSWNVLMQVKYEEMRRVLEPRQQAPLSRCKKLYVHCGVNVLIVHHLLKLPMKFEVGQASCLVFVAHFGHAHLCICQVRKPGKRLFALHMARCLVRVQILQQRIQML
jgi:hypothetical protein